MGLSEVVSNDWSQSNSSLIEGNGLFPPRFGLPREQIDQAEVIKEFDAQLDYLIRIGLTISYFDTHMLLELSYPELIPILREWMNKKGWLIILTGTIWDTT